jgi:hypothetical protein
MPQILQRAIEHFFEFFYNTIEIKPIINKISIANNYATQYQININHFNSENMQNAIVKKEYYNNPKLKNQRVPSVITKVMLTKGDEEEEKEK